MSQRITKKRWSALQIVNASSNALLLASLFVGLVGCVSPASQKKTTVHASVAENAKTLRYVRTIETVGLGSNDVIKRVIAGDDTQKLQRPVAIDIRGNTMIVADSGSTYEHRGMTILSKGESIADAELRTKDNGVGIVYKYDLKTQRMHFLRGVGEHIVGDVSDIYLASDMSFYVTDVEGRRALHFSPEGSLLKIYKHPPNIFRPIAITVDEPRKQVIIADETYSHIVSFDMDKAEPIYGMGGRGEGPGKFRIITDMIPIPDGYLVSDRIELRVQVLDRDGNYVANFGQGIVTFPTALAVDKQGRVYVSDKADSTIKVFKAGKLIDQVGRNGYGPGEFRYVSDMKVLGNQLYVVDSLNGRIQVFEFISDTNNVALAH